MPSSAEQNIGAVINLTAPEEGNTQWVATQVDVHRGLPPGNPRSRHDLDWGLGPIKISGYIDTDTFEIGISVSILGINVGNIYGNLKDGVGLNIDLFLAEGSIKLYLKNGNEVWINVDVSVKFDGSFQGDYKIISF
ncbi:hypothetical protein HYQ45_018626 [Verticillium longisporum]|uniref:Uncharacterized protein n=1 Tax=Verticillium longisporum TaxID=100787 RepID=A0A0G4LK78_VERLO|nr:hypothetical protein HYQ45_018626 [Verticillium longisporum]KAG7127238.1 hypothetical protein HYQ44_000156 [Verticillium longisporum]KAG7144911.1 hypothetical protein HYQ46_006348 [Verticillium longisporum]CRK22314.1 hypothetical protein BN1708_013383 [Verticillium longisporum]CRK48631.1 hypothetical protein BN1723_008124 [Verticillium longisporum]